MPKEVTPMIGPPNGQHRAQCSNPCPRVIQDIFPKRPGGRNCRAIRLLHEDISLQVGPSLARSGNTICQPPVGRTVWTWRPLHCFVQDVETTTLLCAGRGDHYTALYRTWRPLRCFVQDVETTTLLCTGRGDHYVALRKTWRPLHCFVQGVATTTLLCVQDVETTTLLCTGRGDHYGALCRTWRPLLCFVQPRAARLYTCSLVASAPSPPPPPLSLLSYFADLVCCKDLNSNSFFFCS